MARKKETSPEDEIVFVDELPGRGSGLPDSWANRLLPLVKNPGRWARVWIAVTPQQSQDYQSNLHRRAIKIPNPEHQWEFAARGCELYAMYRGRHRGRIR